MDRNTASVVTLLFLCLCCAVRVAHAETETPPAFEPASFGAQRANVLRRLPSVELPPGETLIVRCNGRVESGGTLDKVGCLPDAGYGNRSRTVIRSVTGALDERRVRAARMDGRTVPVWFGFSVRFVGTEAGTEASLHESLLVRPEEAAPGFVAAQRLRRNYWNCPGGDQAVVIVVARVAADGSVSETLVQDEAQGDECPERARRLLENARYIPAHLDGEPVASLYTEFFY